MNDNDLAAQCRAAIDYLQIACGCMTRAVNTIQIAADAMIHAVTLLRALPQGEEAEGK